MTGGDFWLRHALLPSLVFALVATTLAASGADLVVTDHFFDVAGGRFPARNAFWAAELMHRGGRWIVFATGMTAVLVWLTTRRDDAGYVALCFALGPGLVALLKHFSAADCPWALARYAGDLASGGHCFPAGHSSGAFAFFAFYFVLPEPHFRRAALGLALALGFAFAATQWARGAHFPTHDLWSAWICWNVCLVLAAWRLRPSAVVARWPAAGIAS
ncbi:MAG TPA: phosphatase PAP2 family protein [Verrucomicrobiae bacterium]|nr:phosphatase PAP2 family protein [Verrucomicrobiae bacterium]